MKINVFITGYNGHVGKALIQAGFCPLVCDVTNPLQIRKAIQSAKPDLVLHLASKSSIDWCEKNKSEAFNVNVRGAFNVFEALSEEKVPGVFLSSDQIWRGGWFEKHREDSKPTPPVNTYGMSKVSAEALAKDFKMRIIRTSFLFDTYRPEIADKIFTLEGGGVIEVPTFIKRSFLYLPDFVEMITDYCKRYVVMPPILHLAGGKTTSWYDFMREVAKVYGYKPSQIIPKRKDSRHFVPRPHKGGLDISLSRSLMFPYRDYISGIQRMRDEG